MIKKFTFLFSWALLALLIPAVSFAAKIQFLEGSQIQLKGDSTIRKYSSLSRQISLAGSALASPATGKPLAWSPNEVNISLNVNSMKSDSTTLDDHMYTAMKADKYPVISVVLKRFSFNQNTVSASGDITIAGVTKPITLTGEIKTEGDKVLINGTHELLMTDFGVEPPTLMMGTIKTTNKIEIIFNLVTSNTLQEETK
jgi:hypothetical protein